MSTQWHPIFAQLLRLQVEDYYEMRTTMPVGDAPRLADIVLLRRTSRVPPPFRGLWRHLTVWNLLEYKGPTVSPRLRDLELLVELGLGIDRRLRGEPSGRTLQEPKPENVSFWYLANHLGRQFIHGATEKLGNLQPIGPGLWRGKVLSRLVFLTSAAELPVENDALPFHIVGQQPIDRQLDVARLVAEQPAEVLAAYGGWMATLHPAAWKEVEDMARTARQPYKIDFRPAIEMYGLPYIIEQAGLQRVIESIGLPRLIEQIGEKEAIKEIGLDRIIANLTPAQRRELKKRL